MGLVLDFVAVSNYMHSAKLRTKIPAIPGEWSGDSSFNPLPQQVCSFKDLESENVWLCHC